jgi:hypothetical protein
MYEIQRDKELPKQGRGDRKYPWKEMQVGDSFFVPEGDIRRLASAASNASRFMMGAIGKKFVCRTVTEEGIKGVRVFCAEHNLPS